MAAAAHKDLYMYRFHDKNTTGTFRQALISPYVGFIFLTFKKKKCLSQPPVSVLAFFCSS